MEGQTSGPHVGLFENWTDSHLLEALQGKVGTHTLFKERAVSEMLTLLGWPNSLPATESHSLDTLLPPLKNPPPTPTPAPRRVSEWLLDLVLPLCVRAVTFKERTQNH